MNKDYDGGTAATLVLDGATLDGVAYGDDVSLDTSAFAAWFNDSNVGTGIPINVSGLALAGADAGAYTLLQPAYLAANITPFTLIVSATADDKSYDGTTAATVVALDDNHLGGDSVTVAYASAAFADALVGTQKTVTVNGLSLSGTHAGNYALAASSVTATADIDPAELTVTADGDLELAEGATFTGCGTFTDSGSGWFTATVNYGDGLGAEQLTLDGQAFDLSHVYSDNGTFTITVTITDQFEQVAVSQFTVTVSNVAPTLSNVSATPTDATGFTTLTGTITDPGTLDTLELVVAWGDGNSVTLELLAGTISFTLTHTYADSATPPTYYLPTVTLTDKDDGVGSASPYVNNAYRVYLAAVRAADEAYLAAVEQILLDAGAAFSTGSQAAQGELDGAYDAYVAAVDDAQAAYDDAVAAAESARDSAIDAAVDVYAQAVTTAREAYDLAFAAAEQVWSDAEQTALADFNAAIAAAQAAYDDAVAAAQDGLDSAQASHDAALTDAAATLQTALATADTNNQAALGAAAVAYAQVAATAQAAHDAAVAASQAALDQAQAAYDADPQNPALLQALQAAQADYDATTAAAAATLQAALADALQTQASVEQAATEKQRKNKGVGSLIP